MLGVVVYLPEDLPGCAEDATFWIEEIYEEICNRTHVYTLCNTCNTTRGDDTNINACFVFAHIGLLPVGPSC